MSVFFSHEGFCETCAQKTTFEARCDWFRDHLLCTNCGSLPRERALMWVIRAFFPNYADLVIHESSPAGRGASARLSRECSGYAASHYFPDHPAGRIEPRTGIRNENLEAMTLADESVDLFVTQDVMEHVFDPAAAFREIRRVLKPEGAHVFTVPLVNKGRPTERWASRCRDGSVLFHYEPEYHGNPIAKEGSPVTMHWGYDIASFIRECSGLASEIVCLDDIDLGIRAEYIDVVVSRKPGTDPIRPNILKSMTLVQLAAPQNRPDLRCPWPESFSARLRGIPASST